MSERKSKTLFVDLPEHLRDKDMIKESSGAMWYLFQECPDFPEIPEYRDKDLKTRALNLVRQRKGIMMSYVHILRVSGIYSSLPIRFFQRCTKMHGELISINITAGSIAMHQTIRSKGELKRSVWYLKTPFSPFAGMFA